MVLYGINTNAKIPENFNYRIQSVHERLSTEIQRTEEKLKNLSSLKEKFENQKTLFEQYQLTKQEETQ